MNFSTFLQL